MNDQAKRITEQSPKLYSPTKPYVLDLAKRSDRFDAIPFLDHVTYIDLPDLRFIGKDVIKTAESAGDVYGEMWGKSDEFMPILNAMDSVYEEIPLPCALMHHHNLGAETQMHYMIGKFMKACTAVPEGLDYYDISHTMAALAVFRGEFNQVIDCMYTQTRDRILSDGYNIPYPVGYFHAEVYPEDNIPIEGVVSNMAYLFACQK